MHIFIEIGIIIFIATIVSSIVRLFRQPSIVGYILTGVVVGPYLLNLVQSTEYIELFSKLGIAILLFIIGLSLKPDIIREVGKVSIVTGIGQIVVTSGIGFFIMRSLGFEVNASIYGALALTFSSTIIIFKLLADKGDLNKLYGKISIGFLLVQDVVAAIVLLVVSVFGSSSSVSGNATMFTILLLLKAIGFFIFLYIMSRYVLPKLSVFFASSQELLFLFSMSWGLGLSAIFYVFGFSLEIGALAAGIALASSSFAREIGSRMKPLRDFFILLFFVLLGSQIILPDISSIIAPAVILSLFVLIGNPLIVIILMNLLGYKSRTGFLAGLVVAQISEFSLILMSLGLTFGHVSSEAVSLITLVGIITITGSTYLILYADKLYLLLKPILRFLEIRKHKIIEREQEATSREMIIFGYDRVGYDFVNVAKKMKLKYSVVDFNPISIQKLKNNNIPYQFGDAEDAEFLEEVEVPKAKIIISSIPDFKTNLNLVYFYRNYNKQGVIIVLAHNIKDAQYLYKHGASFVIMPHYLGANYASKMVEYNGVESNAFEKQKAEHLMYLEKRQKATEEK